MDAVDALIDRWAKAEAAERANYQVFLSELCDLVEVPRPDPTGLVALNHERAAEEAKGHIRWLRPDYQNPQGTTAAKPDQTELDVATTTVPALAGKLPWPTTLPDKVAVLRTLLPTTGPDAAALVIHFGKRTKSRLTEITQSLDTLRSLGQL